MRRRRGRIERKRPHAVGKADGRHMSPATHAALAGTLAGTFPKGAAVDDVAVQLSDPRGSRVSEVEPRL